MKKYIWIIYLFIFIACQSAQYPITSEETKPDTLESFVSDFIEYKGFYDLYWDNHSGKIFIKVNKLDTEFLYLNSLKTGLGSNDIGLDRGLLGREHIVKFIKNGPKLLLLQPNYDFRAESDNPSEIKAVQEAFATSVLWGFNIQYTSLDGYLIDATDFFLQDINKIAGAIERTNQGRYAVDFQKSAILFDGLKNFPLNTEIEALLTFTGDPKGNYIRQVTPSPEQVTVIQRHSFIQLPDGRYNKRIFDPRAGYIGMSYYDFAMPIDQSIIKRFICRHRLIKKDPLSEKSEPEEPIIYYLDPGVPEPVRSALLEGASWWNEAFEAAGYINAFKVKMLPEGADPLDIRYNMIQWVHRSSRGWSYGRSVVDPRTGEIIKGHVSLGSLRVRQDFLIAQGLLSPFNDTNSDLQRARDMALARIRQLSAHEVGHTLGLVHNYASSVNDRASVMDYPHPLINLNDKGEIDLSQAYDEGIGEWDKIAITYGYADFPDQKDEKEELKKIIHEAINKNFYFISDRDARPSGSAHPYAHLWDNKLNAADELNRIIEIRKSAIDNFGVFSIPEEEPYSSLEDVFVPVYLMHRYQLEAASKILGGLYYTYALRGDDQVITSIIPPENQRMALKAILRTIHPEFLIIPENILGLIPPKAPGYYHIRENFKKKTGLTFDPLAAAESSADLTLSLLLHPERASRLVEHHIRDNKQPSFSDVINTILDFTWYKSFEDPYEAEINRSTSKLVLSHMITLVSNQNTSSQVRAIMLSHILSLDQWISTQKNTMDKDQKAHFIYCSELIRRFRDNPNLFKPSQVESLPMGSPIGMDPIICDF